jgi:transcriptional repressor NrdR
MRCPKCTSIEDKVIDSRISKEGRPFAAAVNAWSAATATARPRRSCVTDVVVIKRDGRREDFDREKLVQAVRAACHKRPIDLEQITMLVDDVMDALEAQFEKRNPLQRHRRRRDAAAAHRRPGRLRPIRQRL